MFTISKLLHFCFYILTKINKPVKLKKPPQNYFDNYIMEVLLENLNAYGSSSLDKPDYVCAL